MFQHKHKQTNPALCAWQVLGAKRKNLAGMSAAAAAPHQGFIYQSPVMATCPPSLRPKAARMIGAKCTLMARVDAYGQDPAGVTGQKFLEEMKVRWTGCG
jgi:U4/U6 small nuclear ribonucleoprotein PRP31